MDGMDKFQSDMAAINGRVDQLIRENAELREALASIVKDRDERSFDIERFVTDELLPSGYWSPSATMVGSGPINRARALLARVSE